MAISKLVTRSDVPRIVDAALPGAGFRDEVQEKLDKVAGEMQQVGADEFKVTLGSAVRTACRAGTACRRILWALADDFHLRRVALTSVIAGVREAAAANVSPYGNGSPEGYRQNVLAAQDQAEQAALSGAVVDAVAAHDADAEAAGKRFADSMKALRDAIDTAYSDATGPRNLRQSVSLERVMMLSALEREFRGQRAPMAYAWKVFSGCVQRGGDDDLRKAVDISEAIGAFVAEVAREPMAKSGALYHNAPDQAFPEKTAAFALLQAFEDLKKAQLPDSIRVANECFDDLRSCFVAICGVDPRLLTRAEFAMKIGTDPAKSDSVKSWEIAPNWTQRALPGARVSLPGWSPPIMRGSSGAYVRAPNKGQ